eukprot:COSAG06_NODE_67163_length_252_cov_1.339869_1_plen_31_part_10
MPRAEQREALDTSTEAPMSDEMDVLVKDNKA